MKRIALAVVLLIAVTQPRVTAVVPSGFDDALVASVGSPTGLAFTPDGRC
jgi:hypothetical protein